MIGANHLPGIAWMSGGPAGISSTAPEAVRAPCIDDFDG